MTRRKRKNGAEIKVAALIFPDDLLAATATITSPNAIISSDWRIHKKSPVIIFDQDNNPAS